MPVFQRIAELNPSRRHEMAAEIAIVHAHLGESAKGIALLEAAVAEQRRLPALRRSFAFCLAAEFAAIVLRHPALAREVATMGRRVMIGSTVEGAGSAPVATVPGVLARTAHRSAVRGGAAIDAVETIMQRRRPRLAIVS